MSINILDVVRLCNEALISGPGLAEQLPSVEDAVELELLAQLACSQAEELVTDRAASKEVRGAFGQGVHARSRTKKPLPPCSWRQSEQFAEHRSSPNAVGRIARDVVDLRERALGAQRAIGDLWADRLTTCLALRNRSTLPT
jgi:hypothetical protein